MLRELAEAAERFAGEGELGAIAYKRWTAKTKWIVELSDTGEYHVKGPYREGDLRRVYAPTRQRSGKISRDNLKPYLLVGDARYVLKKPEQGKEDEATLAHQSFKDLLKEAFKETKEPDLATILRFLDGELPDDEEFPDELRKIGPRDAVTFQCGSEGFPFEKPIIQRFWAGYLERELSAGITAACSVCGRERAILQTLPVPVDVMGQKCQITSFNRTAFGSFGKPQTTSAPLCFDCVMAATQAFEHMTDPANRHHHAVIARDESKGQRNPLRNQLAIFWLKAPARVEHDGVEVDLESMLTALFEQPKAGDLTADMAPPAELAQLEGLLSLPWTGRDSALRLSANSFYLAVLSANKGRLVVRDWMDVSLDQLRERLSLFIQALRVVSPSGERIGAVPISPLVSALGNSNSALIHGLLRTAYLGVPPPQGLISGAVGRFRVPKVRNDADPAVAHSLAAALKLALTYAKEEARDMERLDMRRNVPAYLCGRLLAVLEESQRRASGRNLNATLVDRFYAAASTAPASALTTLINRTQTMHLPKIRRQSRGYGQMQGLLEEILSQLDGAGGFPQVLRLDGQGEFALGYYHQRADFRTGAGNTEKGEQA